MSRTSEDLLFDLKLVDNLVGSSFADADMTFYFAGGSACILAGWIDRTTRDFDFVDLGYSSKLSKVLKLLEPYDLLTNYFAAIPKNYMGRAIKIEGFRYISVYVFSREDIIASKIDRMSDKDIEDIRLLMVDINIETLEKCIQETLDNIVYADRRGRYELNLVNFRHMFIRETV